MELVNWNWMRNLGSVEMGLGRFECFTAWGSSENEVSAQGDWENAVRTIDNFMAREGGQFFGIGSLEIVKVYEGPS